MNAGKEVVNIFVTFLKQHRKNFEQFFLSFGDLMIKALGQIG